MFSTWRVGNCVPLKIQTKKHFKKFISFSTIKRDKIFKKSQNPALQLQMLSPVVMKVLE